MSSPAAENGPDRDVTFLTELLTAPTTAPVDAPALQAWLAERDARGRPVSTAMLSCFVRWAADVAKRRVLLPLLWAAGAPLEVEPDVPRQERLWMSWDVLRDAAQKCADRGRLLEAMVLELHNPEPGLSFTWRARWWTTWHSQVSPAAAEAGVRRLVLEALMLHTCGDRLTDLHHTGVPNIWRHVVAAASPEERLRLCQYNPDLWAQWSWVPNPATWPLIWQRTWLRMHPSEGPMAVTSLPPTWAALGRRQAPCPAAAAWLQKLNGAAWDEAVLWQRLHDPDTWQAWVAAAPTYRGPMVTAHWWRHRMGPLSPRARFREQGVTAQRRQAWWAALGALHAAAVPLGLAGREGQRLWPRTVTNASEWAVAWALWAGNERQATPPCMPLPDRKGMHRLLRDDVRSTHRTRQALRLVQPVWEKRLPEDVLRYLLTWVGTGPHWPPTPPAAGAAHGAPVVEV